MPNNEQGWECPKCGAVLAPWKSYCPCSPPGHNYVPYNPYYVPYNPYQPPVYIPYTTTTGIVPTSDDYTVTTWSDGNDSPGYSWTLTTM